MVAKGYAVVKTNRTASEGLGEITATLEDGSTVDSIAFNDTARYIMDFTDVARALRRQAPRTRAGRTSTCTAIRPAPASATASTTRPD